MTSVTKKTSSCKRSCRKCFPNGCCGFCKPPLQVQKQTDTIIHLKEAVDSEATRYGFVLLYPGVRTLDNSYTCPMLSIHLYHEKQYNADIAKKNRTITVDGRNQQQTHEGEQNLKTTQQISAAEEVIMVPLEDVIRITYNTNVEKGAQADATSHVTPVHELSENRCDRCCAKVFNCCVKTRDFCCVCCQKENRIVPVIENTVVVTNADPNRSTKYHEEDLPLPEVKEGCCTKFCDRFRCWCCRKNKLIRLIKKTTTETATEAKRVVTMTVEYSKYSNLDSASNAHLLTDELKLAYYKDKFQPDKELKFYFISNKEYESTNFDAKKNEAEILSRIVMQLKGMKNRYPSEVELDKILDQSYRRTFGAIYNEPVLQLTFDPTSRDPQSQDQPHQRMIKDKWPTTSDPHEEGEK